MALGVAAVWRMLLLLPLAVAVEVLSSCESIPPEATALLQRSQSVSHESAVSTVAVSAAIATNDSAKALQPTPESPLQHFVSTHPAWQVALSALLLISCFVGLVALFSRTLDQYEASLRDSGEVGRPWYMDDRMTMKVGFGALVIWVSGGMVVFTNLVYFSTAGGEVRPLTRIEAIYFAAQIITTVGYGDLTPSDPAGQFLVSNFILLGVILVGVVFTEMLKVLIGKGERAVVKAMHTDTEKDDADGIAKHLSNRGDKAEEAVLTGALEEELANDMAADDKADKGRLLLEFVVSIGLFAVILCVGTIFYHYYPGEDKTFWEAFYMSCVTLTSVGFGAVTPATQGGKLFASLWMLVGVGATAHMIICFGNWFLKRHREIQVGQLQTQLLEEMDTDGNSAIDKCEFLRFELIRTGLCQKEDIDKILYRFQRLDVDKSGEIDIEDLKRIRRIATAKGE